MSGVEGVDTSDWFRDKVTLDGVEITSKMPWEALLLSVGVLWRCESRSELFTTFLCFVVLWMLLTVMSAVSMSKDLLGISESDSDIASDRDPRL